MPVTHIESFPEFKRAIAQAKLSVLDFHAVWCGPCKAVSPRFEQLAGQFAATASFYKINVDNLPVARECGVSAMPTFQLYKSGKLLETIVGANVAELTRKIQQHAGGAGGGAAFEGSGRVLGTGEKVGSGGGGGGAKASGGAGAGGAAAGAAAGGAGGGSSSSSSGSNAMIWIAVLFLALYWWTSQKNKKALDMDYDL